MPRSVGAPRGFSCRLARFTARATCIRSPASARRRVGRRRRFCRRRQDARVVARAAGGVLGHARTKPCFATALADGFDRLADRRSVANHSKTRASILQRKSAFRRFEPVTISSADDRLGSFSTFRTCVGPVRCTSTTGSAEHTQTLRSRANCGHPTTVGLIWKTMIPR
jgi:hypothetical protein